VSETASVNDEASRVSNLMEYQEAVEVHVEEAPFEIVIEDDDESEGQLSMNESQSEPELTLRARNSVFGRLSFASSNDGFD